jgi:hypothetical protein
MKRLASSELLALLVPAGLFGFVVLSARAALAYSGGTYCEPSATSYRFWGNFFCDLTARVTHRGLDNAHVAALAEAAFGSFALAAAPFFWLLGGLTRRPLIGFAGLGSAVATLVLAFAPSTFGTWVHASAVFGATIPGLFAAGAGVYGLWRRPWSNSALALAALLGAATLAAGLADALGYVYALVAHPSCLPWLPAVQKLVGLLLIAWMLVVALPATRRDAG